MTDPREILQRSIDALEPIYQEAPPVALTDSHLAPTIPPSHAPPPSPYQTQLVDAFLRSPGNESIFLPTGLGDTSVVEAISKRMLSKSPDKHIVICVIRPAQALSHAERLRAVLGVPVGAFCGGDFLYDFEEEFNRNKVLVFTAGLLMRLTKLGTYKLNSASLLVLHDAFSAVRNHPMNTLVREYYWKGPGSENQSERPRILGVVLPQLQQLQRPFDKLRQLVRKLSHSAQAGVLVPTGPALESLANRVHRAHVAMHAYELSLDERELGEALQTHSLLIWDTLHAFGQNHFGRLIHFPPSQSPQQSPQTNTTQQAETPQPASHAARLVASLAAASGSPMAGSPASPALPGSPAVQTPRAAAVDVAVAPPNAAAFASDPMHHDWAQIELMIRNSIACTETLPPDGEHPRSKVAISVMKHVLQCAVAIQLGLELGMKPSLEAILPGLKQLLELINADGNEGEAAEGSIDQQLREKVKDVLPSSPLLKLLSDMDPSINYGGQKGSRIVALLELLREVLRHAEEDKLFVEKSNTDSDDKNGLLKVALVVGGDSSVEYITKEILQAPDLPANVRKWENKASKDEEEESEAPACGEDQLCISILTASEADSGNGRSFIRSCNEAIWFSATDVMHAAGFEFESTALNVFCRESAVGSGSDAQPGPECHILATSAQTATWLEVCRADQLLLAATQLVQAGDASFEGYLGQLSNGTMGSSTTALSVPPPATILHTLCLGLVGRPPQFSLSSFHKPNGRDKVYQAVVILPEEMLAPGNYALPVTFGTEEIALHGNPADSEAEARDAAAVVALMELLRCGLVAAYWQTRALLVQSHQIMTSHAVEATTVSLQNLVISGSEPANLPPSPFFDASTSANQYSNRATSPTRRSHDPSSVVPSEHLICPICGIVTTSEGHLKEHLAGRRHQKNLERLQQQQKQGVFTPTKELEGGENNNDDNDGLAVEESKTKGTPPKSPGSTTPQITTLSTIDRLPSSLSDAFLRRSSSLHRNPSGNVYDGFPCVRVGDVVLPSSMDLRAFLDEMQQAGELELNDSPLPRIDEIGNQHGGGGSFTTSFTGAGRSNKGSSVGGGSSASSESNITTGSGNSGSRSRERHSQMPGRPPRNPHAGYQLYNPNYRPNAAGGGNYSSGYQHQQQHQGSRHHHQRSSSGSSGGSLSSGGGYRRDQQQRYPSRFSQDPSGAAGYSGGSMNNSSGGNNRSMQPDNNNAAAMQNTGYYAPAGMLPIPQMPMQPMAFVPAYPPPGGPGSHMGMAPMPQAAAAAMAGYHAQNMAVYHQNQRQQQQQQQNPYYRYSMRQQQQNQQQQQRNGGNNNNNNNNNNWRHGGSS